jgi:hypothetical protein
MPKHKIEREFIDNGFGFPVRLRNVPMIEIRGAWTPDIDYNVLTNVVLRALCIKPARLTGCEVRFIRQHNALTLQEFAQQFGVSHPAVMKWERTEERPTGMQWGTEKDIRLWVFLRVAAGPKTEREFVSVYESLSAEIPTATTALAETTAFTVRGRKLVPEACAR